MLTSRSASKLRNRLIMTDALHYALADLSFNRPAKKKKKGKKAKAAAAAARDVAEDDEEEEDGDIEKRT